MDKCAACKALLGEPTSKPAHMDLVLDTNGSGLNRGKPPIWEER